MDKSRGRLVSISHVNLESKPGIEDAIQWFYGDWLGLVEVGPEHDKDRGGPVLRFRSEHYDLRIAIVKSPSVEAIDRRLQVEVPSLESAAELLDDRRYPYQWLHGLSSTDQSLVLHDPMGNRVVVRRHWPPSPI